MSKCCLITIQGRKSHALCLLILPPVVSYTYSFKVQPDENFIKL